MTCSQLDTQRAATVVATRWHHHGHVSRAESDLITTVVHRISDRQDRAQTKSLRKAQSSKEKSMNEATTPEGIRAIRTDIEHLSQGVMALTEAIETLTKMMTEVHKACTPAPDLHEG